MCVSAARAGKAAIRWFAAAAALSLAAGARADEADARPVPEFEFFTPLPSLVAAASGAGIPLSGIGASPDRPDPRPGDTATALITMDEQGELTQWLLAFTVEDLTDRERQTAPRVIHLYTSTGHEIDVGGHRVALAVRIFGPSRETDEPARSDWVRENRARLIVNADLLAVGLDHAMEVDQTLAAAIRANQRIVAFGDQPFPPDQVAVARRRAAEFGITERDERALVGLMPAQRSFLRIIVHTPGLAEVLLKVLDVSWWSIVRHGGKVDISITSGGTDVRELALSPWNIDRPGAARAEPFFVVLDGRPALTYRLAAVPPRPPLVTTAGVIGIAAQRPDGTGPELMIQLLSAHCAPPKNE
jgi:hypothetical protein